MNKKNVLIIVGVLIVGVLIYVLFFSNIFKKDSVSFKNEYPKVSNNNKFVYKKLDEVIDTLKTGTAIIYFGFPECPWCQEYVKYLDEVANESDIKEVIYFNILNDRKDNTKEYQEVTKILNDYLVKDDNNNPRIFVPHVVAVKNGKILDNDNETATISGDGITPNDYWTEEKSAALKTVLKKMFDDVTSTICTTDCN